MKDFTPSFCSLVIPESRIKALQLPINNIIGAYESRNVLINYRERWVYYHMTPVQASSVHYQSLIPIRQIFKTISSGTGLRTISGN